MIRKLFTACAGIALLSTSALALDVTGTYAGQGNGQNISVQLQENQGLVRGLVRVGGAEFPLAGQEQGGEVRGVWLAPNGQEIPFAVQVNGGRMEMATNGATYSLRNDDSTAPANVKQDDPRPAPVDVQPQPVQNVQPQQVARPTNVQMEQGQIFARPVPQGWQSQETSNEVYVWAPDNTLAVGFTGMEGLTATTPAQFMQWMIVDIYHRGNFKIIQQHEVPSPDGGQTIEAVVSYTINGQPIKCWVRCTVLTLANSSNGYMLLASATPEKFDAAEPMLIEMANKIQITDVNAVFDRANRLGVIRSIQNNPIPDTIITGYNGRQQIMDGIANRRGDVATDTYKLTSDSGQVYYMGQGSYDPTIGGFRDPQHPERVLKMEPHWNGQ